MVDAPVKGAAAEPTPGPANPAGAQPVGPFCEVDGERVTEFRALISGPAATLITSDGTYACTRVYWDGQFDVGDGKGRCGSTGQKILSAHFATGKAGGTSPGLRVELTGYSFFVPLAAISASWKRPS